MGLHNLPTNSIESRGNYSLVGEEGGKKVLKAMLVHVDQMLHYVSCGILKTDTFIMVQDFTDWSIFHQMHEVVYSVGRWHVYSLGM